MPISKRSRGEAVRDKNISSKTEKQLSIFSSATGLRRNEMMNIESKDLFFNGERAFLNVTKGAKGGKSRIVEICGSSAGETREIVKWIQSKQGRLFPKLNTNYDNHYYRAVYAQRLYDEYKRKEKIYRQKKGISCEKKGLARFMTSKPWKLCPKTWGIIEFQLLHNPICTTRKE